MTIIDDNHGCRAAKTFMKKKPYIFRKTPYNPKNFRKKSVQSVQFSRTIELDNRELENQRTREQENQRTRKLDNRELES